MNTGVDEKRGGVSRKRDTQRQPAEVQYLASLKGQRVSASNFKGGRPEADWRAVDKKKKKQPPPLHQTRPVKKKKKKNLLVQITEKRGGGRERKQMKDPSSPQPEGEAVSILYHSPKKGSSEERERSGGHTLCRRGMESFSELKEGLTKSSRIRQSGGGAIPQLQP